MANITTQTIRVDLSTGKVIPTAYTHQMDTARTLVFDMYNGGLPYSMTGNTVKFAYKSPIVNGQYSVIAGASMASGTVSGNKVTVALPSAYTQISGVGMLTMIITPTSGTVRPVNIRLVVQKSADGDDTVLNASDWPEGLYDYMDEWLAENEPTEIANLRSDLEIIDGQIGRPYVQWEQGNYDLDTTNNTVKTSTYRKATRARTKNPVQVSVGDTIINTNTDHVIMVLYYNDSDVITASSWRTSYTVTKAGNIWILVRPSAETADSPAIPYAELAKSVHIQSASTDELSIEGQVNDLSDKIEVKIIENNIRRTNVTSLVHAALYVPVSLKGSTLYKVVVNGTVADNTATIIAVRTANNLNANSLVKEIYNGDAQDGQSIYFTLTSEQAQNVVYLAFDNKTTNDVNASITLYEIPDDCVDGRLKKIEDFLSADIINSYYYENDYLPQKIESIKSASAFVNGITFAFITDLHFAENSLQSKRLLEKVLHETSTSFVVCGGDFCVAYGAEAKMYESKTILLDYMSTIGKDNWYNVQGNHDFHITPDSTDASTRINATAGMTYDALFRSSERYITNLDTESWCYCLDIPQIKTRFIMLNSSDGIPYGGIAFTTNQMQWLVDRLSEKNGWRYIVVDHVPTDASISASSLSSVQTALVAFKNKTTFTALDVTGDFSTATSDIICHISGHCHSDESHVDNNLLAITTTCDAHYRDDGFNAVAGTITEQAFDVFCIDYDNRTINTVRIGRGSDRNWSY